MTAYRRWRRRVENLFLAAVDPPCRLLAAAGVPPDAVTAAGFVLSLAAGGLYAAGRPAAAGLAVLLAGVCDAVDGMLARRTGRAGVFGAFLDSTLDRLGEIAIFAGLLWHFADRPPLALVCLLALAGALMVSYTRARAEGLGLDCRVGWGQRPERMAVLVAASLAGALPVVGDGILAAALVFLALAGHISMLQRVAHVRRRTREDGSK